MSLLRIWGRRNSVNVQKVMWCVTELDLPHERRDAGLAYGQNDQPWFLALNPNGKVPLIEDGAFTLWESNTVVRYLCAKHDAGGLYPHELAIRADAERWMDWQLSTLARSLAIVFWNLVRKAEADMDAVDRYIPEVNAAFAILDRHLERHAYVAGDRFTMGDIPVGALAHRWLALTIDRPDLVHLERWYRGLTARPPFREHVMLPLS